MSCLAGRRAFCDQLIVGIIPKEHGAVDVMSDRPSSCIVTLEKSW
jgi:hypothetical protein